MKRKWMAGLLTAAVVMGLAGCSSGNKTEPAGTTAGGNDERGSGPEGGGAGKGRAGAVSFQNRDTAGYGRAGKEI